MPEEKEKEEAKIEAVEEGHEEAEGAKELKDRLLRLAAEFDNYKKRSARETDSAKLIGKAELARRLLPIVDEFELAINAIELKDSVDKGIALVFSNFIDVLKKEGLREIGSDGAFDPYRHEIMLTRNASEKEGEIVEVVRKGYMFNGIMLRPASVIVSNGMAQEDNKKV